MYGLTRGTLTLVGVAIAGALIWIGTSVLDVFEENANVSTGEYWWAASFVALGGLTIALSQLLGGWTKWGWPRVSGSVFLLAFVPALIAGAWIVAAAETQFADDAGSSWLADHVMNWSDDLGIQGLVQDLIPAWPVVAFGVGLVFGLTFDTTGPRTEPILRRRRVAAGGAAPSANGEPEDRGVQIREGGTPVASGRDAPPPRVAPPREE